MAYRLLLAIVALLSGLAALAAPTSARTIYGGNCEVSALSLPAATQPGKVSAASVSFVDRTPRTTTMRASSPTGSRVAPPVSTVQTGIDRAHE
ncbi:hypothetical protein GCM10011371_08610 [Novosphingobium marinum]|uniref:Tfp pilus assembly protein FimT n=1 Tax=Novosphingobium marinum TaxID=1514948 RepID=A0A7Z0BSV8_9SPHN|nr:hypothetical protein [Novosphingobium marinum]NYH94549.1 Tfp pilus assembly protein FimT [Novosphingobium marinum]GGC23175.1 hypothetical protein GCM10011371_08610 [Novosphingobium marinum]